MVRKFNSRKPMYNDDSDYKTNAPSYYDDLARKYKLIKLLSEKIWGYDEELRKRFEEWDDLISKFPENVEELLKEWLEDETLKDLINEVLLNDKVDKSYIDGFPLNAIEEGFVGDGITDNTNLFNKYFKKDRPINIIFPEGDYLTKETIYIAGNSNIELIGNVTFIGDEFENGYLIEINGFNNDEENYRLLNNLSETHELLKGSKKLRVNEELVKGDILAIKDPSPGSWYYDRDYYNKGEFVEVLHQVGETVFIKESLKDNYKKSDLIGIMNFKTISIKGKLNIHQKTKKSNVNGIRINLIKDSIVNIESVVDYGNAALSVSRCMGMTINGKAVQGDFLSGSLGYGLVIGNSQDIIYNGSWSASRHGVTHGGGDFFGNIVNRNIIGSGTVGGTHLGSPYVFDTHANSENISFKGLINGSASIAGGSIDIDGTMNTTHSVAFFFNRLTDMNINLSEMNLKMPTSECCVEEVDTRGIFEVTSSIFNDHNSGGVFNISNISIENIPGYFLFNMSSSVTDQEFLKNTVFNFSNIVFYGDMENVRRTFRININQESLINSIDFVNTKIDNIDIKKSNVKNLKITNKNFRETIIVKNNESSNIRIQRQFYYNDIGLDNFPSTLINWVSGVVNYRPFTINDKNLIVLIYPQVERFTINVFKIDESPFEENDELTIWGSIGL